MKGQEVLQKFIFVVIFMFTMPISHLTAQQSYRIQKIYRTYRGKPSLNFRLYYQEDGRILKSETEHISGGYTESIDFVYNDVNETILMNGICSDWMDVERAEVKLSDGKIISYKDYYEGNMLRNSVTYYYDIQGCVSKFTEEIDDYLYTVEWKDGNVVRINVASPGGYEDKTVEYTYTEYPNPQSNTLFSPFMDSFDAFYIAVPGNFLSNLLGGRNRNLPKRMDESPKDFGDDPTYDEYDYVFDAYGNISELIVTDDKGEYLHFWITYEMNNNTAIQGILHNVESEVNRYNSLGQKIKIPVKGLNIIKYGDNKVKKILVK